MAADRPLELESFVGTVPAMLYRSRLTPEPYLIEFVTDEMTSIAGYPATDFMGAEPRRRWLELVHPDDIEGMRATLRGAPADGEINEVEYRVQGMDRSYSWILSRFRKLSFEDGSVWVHGAALDVTARHEAEALRVGLESERARADALEQSRARIVEAGDEARRRLERDLHDGAQQRLLVSLLTLRRATKAADGSPAAPLVAEAVGHLEQGLAELRELARGIHPSQLSEQGLADAVRRLAERAPLPVEVDVPEQRLPQSVEIAFYFTVAEALTNVARYAGATQARVTVTVLDGTATAEITDDGCGGASTSRGSGLRGLADRLEAIGGSLELESDPDCGTVVRASAPLRATIGP